MNDSGSQISVQPLKSRALKAGAWLVGIRIFQQLLALSRPLILARILAPEDFGIIGIAFMTRMFIEQIGIGGGFHDALIRKDDITKEQISTAWTFEVSRVLSLGVLLAVTAPWIADFFNAPNATPILRITGLELSLAAFTSIGMLFVRKELQFKKEFYYRLIPTLLGTGITIWLAFELRNVWALALGQLTQTIAMLVMSYVLAPYFIRPSFAFRHLKEMAGFAIWTSVSNLASVVTSQADRLFVGRLLGPTALGLYVVGGRITNLVSMELMNAVVRVGFPAFSKVQRQDKAFNDAFSQLVSSSIYILGPLALFLAIWAPEIVEVLLGPKWSGSVSIVRVLAGGAILMTLLKVYVTALRSKGLALIGATADVLRLIVTASTAYPLISTYGLSGAGYAFVFGLGVAFIFLVYRSRNNLKVGITGLASYVGVGILLSGGLLAVYPLRELTYFSGPWELSLAVLSFTGVYAVGSLALYYSVHRGPVEILAGFRSRPAPVLVPQSPIIADAD